MKNVVYLLVIVSLLCTGFLPAAATVYAQQSGGAYTTPIPLEVPDTWTVYEDTGGAWWLKRPAEWAVKSSVPGEVDFEWGTFSTLNVIVEDNQMPIPFDNWLALDLIGQGVVQGLVDQPGMKLTETGRWFRGVFGLFFALETTEPQLGLTIPLVVVVFPFGDKKLVRATFTVFAEDDKNTVGALLSSITTGRAPATAAVEGGGQQTGGGAGFLGIGRPTEQAPVPTTAVVTGPQFGPLVFAEDVDANGQPIRPANSFPAGVTAVHAVFAYSGMTDGIEYTVSWYMNDMEVFSEVYAWDLGPQGSGASVVLSNSAGFPAGEYGAKLLIGGQVIREGTFSVGEGGPVALATPAILELGTPMQLEQPTLSVPLVTPMQLAQPTLSIPQVTPMQLEQPTLSIPQVTPMQLEQPTLQVPADTPAPLSPPTPEPRGRSAQGKIVFTQFDGDVPSLWVMNVDGSGKAPLTNADHASDPSWSPDGTSIIFSGWDGNPRGGSGIYTMDADGSNVKQIWNEGSASYLDWSSPGRYIALTSIVAGTGNRRLGIYDGREGKWTDIGPGEQASFSPDGDRLVTKSCVGGDCGLYIMNRDGSNKWRLTMEGSDAMPAWSPSGDLIAYSSQRSGDWDIWVVNADGSGNTQLTTDPNIDAMPVWLPDSSGIVFRSARGGSWGIWAMDADGGNPVKLADSSAGNDWGRARLDVK